MIIWNDRIFNYLNLKTDAMKKILMFFMLTFLTVSFVLGQTIQITGTVTSSEDGSTLPGVSVVAKGTTIGVSTDINGKYSIAVPEGTAALEVSFIGMKTIDIPVDGRNVIDIIMEADVLKVDEVVVIGYGTAKRVGTAVGSVKKVSSDELEDRPSPNVFDALQGKVAGVQTYSSSGEPTELSSVRLHGVGSLGASSTPLYVVDGVPVDNSSILALNSNDFESVTVLKDASATSIYGSRAANGVIYITTKGGKRNMDAKITVTSQYGVSNLASKDFFESFFDTKGLTDFWIDAGYRTKEQIDILLEEHPYDTKWYEVYYKENAPTSQTNVSITGGNERTSYFISGGYYAQEGLAARSDYSRYTLRSNVNSTVTDWLSFGVNLSGSTDERQTNPYGTNSTNRGLMMLAQPYYSPYDENGDRYEGIIPGWGRYDPFYLAEKRPEVKNRYQLNGMGYIQLNPLDGLVIRSQAGLDAYHNRRNAKTYPSFIGSLGNGSVTEEFEQNVIRTITNTVEYKFNLAGRHAFTLLAGHEGVDNSYEIFSATSNGHVDDRLMLLEAGPNNKADTHERSQYAFLSYFGRIDYALDNKYYFDLSVRQDASSRFGINNRTANFWAAGAMWNVKKEAFLESADFISSLSVKASIGTSGNSEIDNYTHLALVGTDQYDGNTAWVISSSGNPNLSWEEQTKATFGVRFSILDERFRFNIEYYNRTTKNQLIEVPFPYTSGFDEILTNIGAIKNTGIDFEFDFDIVRTGSLYITPYVNFNYNRDEITELFQGKDHWILQNTGVCWAVGKPVSFFWPVFAGVDPDDGAPMWYVPGEDITETTKEATTKEFISTDLEQNTGKNLFTPMTGGFGLNAGYKGFALQADFTYALGKYLINNDRYFFENPNIFSSFNMSERVLDYWKEPGDVTEFPGYSVAQFTQFDSRLIEDASFMRLKNFALSYTLPKNLLARTNVISGAKVYVSGRNLLTFTNYLGPDPEVDSNLTLGAYPNTKQYTVGIEITF